MLLSSLQNISMKGKAHSTCKKLKTSSIIKLVCHLLTSKRQQPIKTYERDLTSN